MQKFNHAVVWIDHHEAKIFHFNHDEVEKLILQPENPTVHIHHKGNTIGSGHEPEDQHYLHNVATALKDAKSILITGPANAKTELVKHIQHHEPLMMKQIAGVETIDHPSDNKLVAFARSYFKSDHQTKPRDM